jgi:hypothetical protein
MGLFQGPWVILWIGLFQGPLDDIQDGASVRGPRVERTFPAPVLWFDNNDRDAPGSGRRNVTWHLAVRRR